MEEPKEKQIKGRKKRYGVVVQSCLLKEEYQFYKKSVALAWAKWNYKGDLRNIFIIKLP